MTHARHATTRRLSIPRGAGLTLPELLLALVLTSLVGLGVGTMMVATAYGTSSRTQMRSAAVRVAALSNRLDASLRSCKRVLEAGSNYVILWTADSRADDKPNLSELRLIERNPATGDLTSYTANFGSMTDAQIEAADTAYDTSTTNFYTTCQSLKSGGLFPGTVWSKNVTAWTHTFVGATVTSATAMGYRLTVTVGNISETAVGTMALRNR
ncbi:MAG: hypothetical protein GC162_12610 [Planctomycetes bacterium]|nr:hypothetical protein [Planctomycetota bacterium]